MAKNIFVNIIGSGNVATHLIREFLKHPEIKINQVYARNLNHLKEFEGTLTLINDIQLLQTADITFLSISDDAVSEFSKKIKNHNGLTVHTSGSLDIKALKTPRKGVFYPFQSFSKNKNINFKEVPLLIEAENQTDSALLKKMAHIISNNVNEVNSEQRLQLHIAGVIVANFTNFLYFQAEQLLKQNNLSFDLLKPLIREVAEKVNHLSPAEAQTGPAVRKDNQIIKKHLQSIKNQDLKEIYKLLSDNIQKYI